MTLRFSSVQFVDQGSYECQGRSNSTQIPVRTVFNINVQCTRCQSYSQSIWALLFSSSVQYSRSARRKCMLLTAAPYWIVEPTDLTVGLGDTANFTCAASGLPSPQVRWFINSVPIEQVR